MPLRQSMIRTCTGRNLSCKFVASYISSSVVQIMGAFWLHDV
jgi:hypothetical protein